MKKAEKKKKISHSLTEGSVSDVLKTVNGGFQLMEERFQDMGKDLQEIKEALNEHTTILDGHTKMLERIDQERIFTEYAVKRVENEIETIKKRLHASS